MVRAAVKAVAIRRAQHSAVIDAFSRWSPSLTAVASLLPLILLYWQLGGHSALLSDPNTGVHVRTGEWILLHHAAPKEDLFSFSIQGHAWCDWEWLSDALYALLYRWNGLAAIATVSLAVLSGMAVVIYQTVCLYARAAIALVVTFLAMAATTVHWLARPHLFSWLFLALLCWLLEKSRATGRKAWLLAMPVLMVLWANLHPGFVAGLALLGVWFVGAAVNEAKRFLGQSEAARREARALVLWLGLIALACVAATLLNPYGLYRHLFWYLFSPSSVTGHVAEWLSPDFHNPRLYWFALLVPACAASGFWSATRGQFAWSVMSLGGLLLALMAVRNVPLCAVLCTAPIASFVEEIVVQHRVVPTVQPGPRGFTRSHHGTTFRLVLVVAALGLCWVGPLQLAPDSSIAPAVIAHLAPGRVFTTDSWADYIRDDGYAGPIPLARKCSGIAKLYRASSDPFSSLRSAGPSLRTGTIQCPQGINCAVNRSPGR